jgi:mannitol-specific phosphotransferase system IIBC component
MQLFAYHQQDYNGFVLFFNDNGTIRRANVENIHGLKDLLGNDSIRNVPSDSKAVVQHMLDTSAIDKGPELMVISLKDLIPKKDIEGLIAL